VNGRAANIIKVRCTGRPADASPGTVGARVGTSLEVACADEWLLVDKVLVDARSQAAADALQHVARIDDGV
jgi:hypothetical protein